MDGRRATSRMRTARARRLAEGIRDVAPHRDRTEALMQEDQGRYPFTLDLPQVQPVAASGYEGGRRVLVHRIRPD